ncbi:hydrogenase-4 component G [Halarcobacter sp.]|uniref:hydrogenase-4 component G n=1 Tax=Halarcobacter sp. TaxID=2321133 RepID=UPI002AA690A2|nr:hydrogenase-4 component G [Halarcobacter sp.]
MSTVNTENYYNAYQASDLINKESSDDNSKNKSILDENKEVAENKIHSSAVQVSISMESLKMYLNIKSAEFNQTNTNAQNSLLNIINNSDIYDFLSGKDLENGFSLSSIGYEGKPITELNPEEAKKLVEDDGFFSVNETSDRVSSFVIGLAGNDIEALKEARSGVVKGFEEAEKMWGGQLPDISYKTQERTLSLIDEKIAELSQTDLEKKVEEDK